VIDLLNEQIREIPLSKTTSFIVDNRGKTAPTVQHGIPLIATNCINNKNLFPVYENLRYVSDETYKNWFRSHPIPGDIILTLKGSQNGAVCLVPDPVDFVIAQDMVALRVDESVIDANYLFAALRSEQVQVQIKNLDVSGVIPHLKKSDFDKLMIPYPSRNAQKYIGENYISLSNKIDLLNRQNTTLEAMAETLFRQWFVEKAQEDWDEGTLKDEFDFTMGQSPAGSSFNEDGLGVPMFQGNADFGFRFPTERVYTTEPARFAEPMDTLISVRAPVGAQNMAKVKCCIGRGVAAFRYKSNPNFYTYTYFKLRSLMEEIKKFNDEGTVFGSISKSDFENLVTSIPNDKDVKRFEVEAKPINDKIINNCEQIQTLEKLRDNLLPKLMSGEVRIQDA
jgi:type I restriction enzyme S subunit